MRKVLFLTLALPFFVAVFSSYAEAWLGRKDNKTVAELELMNERELQFEASDVCGMVAVENAVPMPVEAPAHRARQAGRVVDGLNYLELIGRVVRKSHGGEYPQWMLDVLHAASGAETIKCVDAIRLPPRDDKKTSPGSTDQK